MPEPEPVPPTAEVPNGPTNTYPVLIGQSVVGVATATIAVLNGFEIVHWTAQQVGLVLTLITALVAMVYAFISGKVYSPATVAQLQRNAKAEVPPDVAARLAEAEARARLADEIVAKLGPPPADPSPRSMNAGHVPPPEGPPPGHA